MLSEQDRVELDRVIQKAIFEWFYIKRQIHPWEYKGLPGSIYADNDKAPTIRFRVVIEEDV
jgi:hypothetical protein